MCFRSLLHMKERRTLKDLFDVPANVYPVGRLDYDSEGLLILTDDKYLNNALLNPSNQHEREYWVQVEGNITQKAIASLQQGVSHQYQWKNISHKKMLLPK